MTVHISFSNIRQWVATLSLLMLTGFGWAGPHNSAVANANQQSEALKLAQAVYDNPTGQIAGRTSYYQKWSSSPGPV